jgi:dUTP pyrophosphatase
MEILIKKLVEHAKLPAYATEAESGMDVYALEAVAIEPGASVVVNTGIAMAVPVGYVGFITSQHSLELNERIKVTSDYIDSGYRGELRLELTNTGGEVYHVNAGDVVGQIFVQQVHRATLIEAADLSGE